MLARFSEYACNNQNGRFLAITDSNGPIVVSE